jgi:ribosomal protein S18 acetylase RimI-like enzyme
MKIRLSEIASRLLLESDYSGEYSDLTDFIDSNKLQQEFIDKYNSEYSDITLDNWDDFTRGDFGTDEEIIEYLAGNSYRVSYNDDTDYFKVSKKKSGRLTYKIKKSNSKDIKKVFSYTGINSEYPPRFAVMVDGKIVGGSTCEITDNTYHFDIAILNEYQGYGILKKLLEKIIKDAKYEGVGNLKSQLVNTDIKDYLSKMGFKIEKSSGIYHVSLSV